MSEMDDKNARAAKMAALSAKMQEKKKKENQQKKHKSNSNPDDDVEAPGSFFGRIISGVISHGKEHGYIDPNFDVWQGDDPLDAPPPEDIPEDDPSQWMVWPEKGDSDPEDLLEDFPFADKAGVIKTTEDKNKKPKKKKAYNKRWKNRKARHDALLNRNKNTSKMPKDLHSESEDNYKYESEDDDDRYEEKVYSVLGRPDLTTGSICYSSGSLYMGR